MFKKMEVAGQVYEGLTTSKTPTRAEANRDGHVRKLNGGEYASPTKPDKGCAGKSKTKNAGHPSDAPTRSKNICLLHGPGHTYEECKSISIYSKSTPRSGPTKTKNPDLAVILSAAKPLSPTKIIRKSMSWKIVTILSQGRKVKKGYQKWQD